MTDEYPELGQFLGGYFHEDFETYAPTWEGVVDFYASETPEERRRHALYELNLLLAANDSSVSSALRAIGVAYSPQDTSDREWLIAVRDRLAASL